VLALALAAALTTSAALAPGEVESAYRAMLAARYATRGVPVAAGGVEFAIDSARFRLAAGELRAMEPVAGGRTTGIVFRGDGSLTLELPDSRELEQFRRFAERPEARLLETKFTTLVLRDGGGLAEKLAGGASPGPFAPDPVARERQEVWLERRLVDADAWVARALAGDNTDWVLAEIDAGELGWLTIEFDPDRAEELQVAKWRPDRLGTELWISLDRASERGADGRPASELRRQFDLVHAAIAVDLRKPSKYPRAGISDIQPRRARFEVELTIEPRRPDARTLALDLDPWSELEAVSDESGKPLAFLRDHVGARSTGIDDQLWDNSVIVLLPGPIGTGERKLRFVYEAEILNYVAGRAWYPGEEEAHADPHTAELAITALPKHELRAMGRELERRDDKNGRFRRYAIERPTRMATFAFAEKFEEQRIEADGGPAIVAFSARGGTRDKAYNVAADVANAWRFFDAWLGRGPEAPTVYATSIVGFHGQAFEGFLHLAEASWEVESRGPTELFRAHEVAHSWWGHLVGWRSYRDQWLSEACAEDSAMRFVEAVLPDGKARYAEMVETMAAAAMGETKVSRFRRHFAPPVNPNQWGRVGPIAHGFRATTVDVRDAFYVQSYYRGALALHMLRGLLAAKSGGDRLFDSVLAEFAREFRGRDASTADFVAVLTRLAPGDWSWFFRQWIESAEVPTWKWQWRAAKGPQGAEQVTIEVEQTGVGAGFRTPVPVRLEWGGGESREQMVLIDEARETFTLAVEKPPRKVTLNPDMAVLARTIRR
jgi:hypothetical protein